MRKVIICDDEVKICRLIIKLINWEELGYEVAGTADNGLDALELIKSMQPDLVVTDISMPECDGIGLLREARKLIPDLPFIIISGYRHFDYAKSAIKYGVEEYLLKPIDENELREAIIKISKNKQKQENLENEINELKTDAKKVRNRINEEFAKAVVCGQKDIFELCRDYDVSLADLPVTVMLVHTTFSSAEYSAASMNVVHSKIKYIINKELGKVGVDYYMSNLDEGVFVILNASDDIINAKNQYYNIIKEININNEVFPGINTVIGLSNKTENISEISSLVLQAKKAAFEQFNGKRNTVIDFSEIKSSGSYKREIFDEDMLSKFNNSIEYLEIEKMENLIREMFEIMNDNGFDGYEHVRGVQKMFEGFISRAANLGLTQDNREVKEFCTIACAMATKRDLYELLIHRIIDNMKKYKQIKNENTSKPIKDIKEYINNHYMYDICLDDLSTELGLNSSYISSLFKKETRENIKDYIFDRRINEAIRLLLHTDNEIWKISNSVGYNDEKYFIKQFKKATGNTPAKYRKMYKVK